MPAWLSFIWPAASSKDLRRRSMTSEMPPLEALSRREAIGNGWTVEPPIACVDDRFPIQRTTTCTLAAGNSKPGRRMLSAVCAYAGQRISLPSGPDELLEYLPTSNAFDVRSVLLSRPCPVSITFSNNKTKFHAFFSKSRNTVKSAGFFPLSGDFPSLWHSGNHGTCRAVCPFFPI
jgi:hypothetical protein